jgi:aldehyde dehydrogenase (NAD+)
MAEQIAGYWQNFIDGEFVDGGAGRLVVDDPATGEIWPNRRSPMRAMWTGPWPPPAPATKRRAVFAQAGGARPHGAGDGPTICSPGSTRSRRPDAGKRQAALGARIEVEGAARYFEYYGNQAETVEGRSIPLGDGYFDFTVHEPYGVSAQIIPWNYPLEMTARSLSAAWPPAMPAWSRRLNSTR